MAEFHFLRPLWFLAIVPLLGLIWLAYRTKAKTNWDHVCDRRLAPFILEVKNSGSRATQMWIGAIASLLAVLALAGPTWEKLPQPVFNSGSDLIILLDLSRSMDSTDITPTRLTQARFEIAELLKQRKEGNTALIVYAADAFSVTPLTTDNDTITAQLMALETDIMPAQGSRVHLAIEKAHAFFKQAGVSDGKVLLVTDGVDDPDAEDALSTLRAAGHQLSVLAVGTQHGAPIPVTGGGFLLDKNQQPVVPTLDTTRLSNFAHKGGGRYFRLSQDHSLVDQLIDWSTTHQVQSNTQDTSDQTADIWEEQGPWLLLPVLLLAVSQFRKGLLVALVFFLPFPQPASALSWDDLWLRTDQQAQKSFEADDFSTAKQQFGDHTDWQAATEYRLGNHEKAAELLKDGHDAQSAYNYGNALAKSGQLKAAKSAYEKALAQVPDMEDAQFNLDLINQQLQKQNQQNQQSDQNNQQHDDQNESDKNGDQQSSDDQKQGEGDSAPSNQSADGTQDSDQDSDQNKDSEQPPSSDPSSEQADQDQTPQDAQPKPNTDPNQSNEDQPEPSAAPSEDVSDQPLDENQLAREQWLRRIPDDPGGLLRRKFMYQYKQRNSENRSGNQPW